MARPGGFVAIVFACVMSAQAAHAETIVAPVGGLAIGLGAHRVMCTPAAEAQGWSAEPDAHHLKPPPKGPAGSPVVLHVASDAAHCASDAEAVTAVAIDVWPVVDPASVVVSADAGRVDVLGRDLRGVVLAWAAGGKQGSDVCHDPQTDPNRDIQSCAFTIEQNLPADPAAFSLLFLPINVQLGDGVSAYDGLAHPVRLERFQYNAAKVVIASVLPVDASMDADADVARIPLKRPEAVSTVDCTDAICDIDGKDIVVRSEHGSDENLEMRIRLRPHVYLQSATALESFPNVVVPLQRCPLMLVSAPPLRGIANQNLVLRIGGRCRKDNSLRFFVSGASARLVSSREEDDSVYAVVHFDAPPGDDVAVSMQRGGSVVGVARAKTRLPPTVHARVELPGYGAIDFIPSNRDASVVLPSLGDSGVLAPLSADGIYSVTRDANGVDHLRGVEGTTGWVALRLAYRDKALPTALRDTNLAEFTDAVDRSIHAASLPIGLGASAESKEPIVELVCDDKGQARRIIPGQPTSVAFKARDTCHVVLHRELLRADEGDQTIRINVSVNALDGAPRAEAALDQRIVLKPGKDPQYLYINGVAAPFDRIIVRATLLADDTHYAVSSDKINAPQVQWSVIMGTDPVRLFATIALPTGLFRVADRAHSGLLGLNAGILARLVGLTETGYQWPVGLEAGVMWLGITGDTTPSGPLGQFAVVAGLSASVPIANPSRTTQAAISLHAWFEWEISRQIGQLGGSAIGFIFGPSLSLGDVGVNF